MQWTPEAAALAAVTYNASRTTQFRWKRDGEIPDRCFAVDRKPITKEQASDEYMFYLLLDLGYINGYALDAALGRNRGTTGSLAKARRDLSAPPTSLRRKEMLYIKRELLDPIRYLVPRLVDDLSTDGTLPSPNTLDRLTRLLSRPALRIRRCCQGLSHGEYRRIQCIAMAGYKWNLMDRPLLKHLLTLFTPLVYSQTKAL